MLLDSRTTRLLIEAAEATGIPRARLLEPLGMTEHEVMSERVRVEWTTVVLLCDEVSRIVGGDVARLRAIGGRMTNAPSYEPLRRLAGTVVSARTLYEIANRWVAPASFPHLSLISQFVSRSRLQLHGEIPDSYAACAPFMHLFEGSIRELPVIIGLPPATLVASRVTARSIDLVVELPPGRSVLGGLRRRLSAVARARTAFAVLDEERARLTANIEALQGAREEMRVILDRLPDMVLVHTGGKITWANSAFASALGYETSEVFGRMVLDFVAPPSRALYAERAGRPSGDAGDGAVTEAILQRRDGGEVIVEVAPTQTIVFDGVPARLVVGRDVSERVRMQQRLNVADRLASMGLLAAGVAHEVNNPLAYVLNNIEMARKELAGLGPEADRSRHVLSVALEGVDRIRTIVRDLLMLARGESGPVAAIDLENVVESTLTLAAREIERTARLARDFRPVPPVEATDARIAQLLLNLFANALEAMRGRPTDENLLEVRIAPAADGRVLLEVSDTGRGIAPRDLPHLFEPFFTTKPSGQGTGLGLSIAQRLVSELGGEIRVTSRVGRGTTFRVLLPPAESAAASDRAPDARESYA